MPLLADLALARAIEGSVVRDLSRLAENYVHPITGQTVAETPFAGGRAFFFAPDSPVNMIYGAGLDGEVSPVEVDAVERFYAERGARGAISLSPLAEDSLVAQLGVRGWMLTDFENVLVRELPDAAGARLQLPPPPPGVAVRVALEPADRAAWAAISSGAFTAPEPPGDEVVRLGESMAARDDVELLIGTVGGQDAGSGALWVDGALGWMLGDATLPRFRRRGVQSALLAERTRLAAEAGCEFAVTEARPGGGSQRNMERLGYCVVYTRVELIAPPM